MIVNVVVRNIDKGVPRHQLYCPIARAINELTGKSVAVVKDGIVYDMADRSIFGYLPKEAIENYIKYDHTGFMRPFTFEMQLASAVTV